MSRPMSPASPSSGSAPLLSILDVAKRLGVSGKTVRRLIKNKAIAIHRIGPQIRISETDLALYVRGQRGM